MKTSNYIAISFLIFLFGGILLLFVGAKNYESSSLNATLTQEKPLESFSVVVGESGANFILKNGNQNKIVQKYLKELAPSFAPFAIRNDTLFIYSVKKEQSKEPYFIIVPEIFCENLKSIIAKEKSYVYLKDFKTDTISVNLNKADIHGNFDKISFFKVLAKESNVNLDGENIDKLKVEVDKTQLNLHLKNGMKAVNGSLNNHSRLNSSLDGNVNLFIDSTSSINSIQ